MKIICDDAAYIELRDLDVMFPAPKCMASELDQECYTSTFIKFTNKDSIECIKQNENILSYNLIKDLSDNELDEKINEVYIRLDRLASIWLGSSTTRRRVLDRDIEYNTKVKMCRHIYDSLKKYKENKSYYESEIDKLTKDSKTKRLK